VIQIARLGFLIIVVGLIEATLLAETMATGSLAIGLSDAGGLLE
jgi:hypothetical protein